MMSAYLRVGRAQYIARLSYLALKFLLSAYDGLPPPPAVNSILVPLARGLVPDARLPTRLVGARGAVLYRSGNMSFMVRPAMRAAGARLLLRALTRTRRRGGRWPEQVT